MIQEFIMGEKKMLTNFILKNDFKKFEEMFVGYGNSKVRNIRKGTVINNVRNSISDNVFYIMDGIIKFSLCKEDGSEYIIAFFGEGSMTYPNWNNEPFAIEKFEVLTAVTNCSVIELPSHEIVNICSEKSSGGYLEAILKYYNRYINTIHTKLLLHSQTNSEICIRSFIYLYYNKSKPSFYLTQDELAQITGFSRTQVTRVLTKLRSEGAIETSRNRIKIADIEKLKIDCSEIIT